jgi:DNA N-6-adenine-methyltransferase (Dam).
MGGPSIKRGESSGDIWTPWEFIRAVEHKFGPIAIDLAASGPQSAKAARWITPEEDSLRQDWTTLLNGGLGWDNYPYSNITPWARYHELLLEDGVGIDFWFPKGQRPTSMDLHVVFERDATPAPSGE